MRTESRIRRFGTIRLECLINFDAKFRTFSHNVVTICNFVPNYLCLEPSVSGNPIPTACGQHYSFRKDDLRGKVEKKKREKIGHV